MVKTHCYIRQIRNADFGRLHTFFLTSLPNHRQFVFTISRKLVTYQENKIHIWCHICWFNYILCFLSKNLIYFLQFCARSRTWILLKRSVHLTTQFWIWPTMNHFIVLFTSQLNGTCTWLFIHAFLSLEQQLTWPFYLWSSASLTCATSPIFIFVI